MSRKESNEKLLGVLRVLIESYPGQRFSQILRNYGFVCDDVVVYDENGLDSGQRHWRNEFYQEPEIIFDRVVKTMKGIK